MRIKEHDGPGRPSLGTTEKMSLRLTPEQKAFVESNGGGEFVRLLIDRAIRSPKSCPKVSAKTDIQRAKEFIERNSNK